MPKPPMIKVETAEGHKTFSVTLEEFRASPERFAGMTILDAPLGEPEAAQTTGRTVAARKPFNMPETPDDGSTTHPRRVVEDRDVEGAREPTATKIARPSSAPRRPRGRRR